ncbi:MAG: glycosyltransferase [Erysipelotrichia bacterium]|nr:glycosyltransferase [Erysipelotrichia bacterium]
MKVLVYFQPKAKRDIFEGARMRKTIKGALEVADVQYTSNLYDAYDIAHFMSPDDEGKINIALEKGAPVVVSALFGENDPASRFIIYRRNKEGKKVPHLKQKALRMMNKAAMVLAPTQSAKDFLIKNGVFKSIEIVPPGINLARFNFSRSDEKELFYRYFREDKTKKLVLALGEYSYKMEGIDAFLDVARGRDDVVCYFVGPEPSATLMNKISKRAPKNAHFISINHEDIYRSMLLNADVFMLPGYQLASMLSVEEALAANCQLIARKSAVFPDFIKNGETGYVAEYSETLTALVNDYLDEKIVPTTKQAYEKVSTYNLQQYGIKLLTIYNALLKK